MASFEQIDRAITGWMARHGVTWLRVSLGIVFVWFGFLKFFVGLSPASDLAARTFVILSFHMISAPVALVILATWETLIGLGLIFGVALRATLLLLFVQMLGTITPLMLFPSETFTHIPYAPTLEGQYIIKNIVLVSAAIVIGATVRGGRMVPEPIGKQPTDPRPRRYTQETRQQ